MRQGLARLWLWGLLGVMVLVVKPEIQALLLSPIFNIFSIRFWVIAIVSLLAIILNTVAGGGNIILFWMLVLLDLPQTSAAATVASSLLPGALVSLYKLRAELKGDALLGWACFVGGLLGGLYGCYLLLQTGEKLYSQVIPYLILLTGVMLALQTWGWPAWMKKMFYVIGFKGTSYSFTLSPAALLSVIFLVAIVLSIYATYFGGGVALMTIAALTMVLRPRKDELRRIQALRQCVASGYFSSPLWGYLPSGDVNWEACRIMLVASFIAGIIGTKIFLSLPERTLRIVMIVVCFIIGGYYLWRG